MGILHQKLFGGEEYKEGKYLQSYQLEIPNEYERRLEYTPLDNHCRNVVSIYSSFYLELNQSEN